jgi:phosphoglycerate dehydrogenase-like enzyme
MMSPRLASTLPDLLTDALRGHPAAPEILRPSGRPWDVPRGVRALFAYQSHWKGAPAEPPAGWPFDLEWLQIASAGVDTLPAWVHGVPLVCRAAGVHAPAIAEYVIGAVFAHEKRFWTGAVNRSEGWVPYETGSVVGRRLGIAGLGAIGREIARLSLSIGMSVSGLSRTGASMDGVRAVPDLARLLAESDHLVVALPLTADTRGIVDARALQAAKHGLHLINIARGAIVDQPALLAALDAGRLAAATLDVTDPEPLPAGHPFYTHPANRLTPPVSGAVAENDRRMADMLVANLDAWLAGRPLRGRVTPGLGY